MHVSISQIPAFKRTAEIVGKLCRWVWAKIWTRIGSKCRSKTAMTQKRCVQPRRATENGVHCGGIAKERERRREKYMERAIHRQGALVDRFACVDRNEGRWQTDNSTGQNSSVVETGADEIENVLDNGRNGWECCWCYYVRCFGRQLLHMWVRQKGLNRTGTDFMR